MGADQRDYLGNKLRSKQQLAVALLEKSHRMNAEYLHGLLRFLFADRNEIVLRAAQRAIGQHHEVHRDAGLCSKGNATAHADTFVIRMRCENEPWTCNCREWRSGVGSYLRFVEFHKPFFTKSRYRRASATSGPAILPGADPLSRCSPEL